MLEIGAFNAASHASAGPCVAMSYDGSVTAKQHGYQAHVGPMLSPSRGRVSLVSNDPFAAPRIRFDYMSHAEDWRVFRQAIRAAREIFAQSPLAEISGEELAPGPSAVSDAELDEFIAQHAESAYHPCGTCRMGSDDDAVVDPSGLVRGVGGVRVVDASIFPHIPNANLNGPVLMVAERIARKMTAA